MVKIPMWHFSSMVTLKKTFSKEAPKKVPNFKMCKGISSVGMQRI